MPQVLQVGALAAIVRAVKLAREVVCGSAFDVTAGAAMGCDIVRGIEGAAITSPTISSCSFR